MDDLQRAIALGSGGATLRARRRTRSKAVGATMNLESRSSQTVDVHFHTAYHTELPKLKPAKTTEMNKPNPNFIPSHLV